MSQRTTITGPALIRLLARLSETEVPESQLAFADRLSQWLTWTDAISLSAALNGSAASASVSGARTSATAEEGECARLRSALAKSMADDQVFVASKGREQPAPAADATPDFAPFRLRYQARQHAMEVGIGTLRERLRTTLAARSPALARLAALDAVMERVLGGQEHRLLASVPGWLEKHFERLRQAEQAGWQALFGQNMHAVLLAELDIRFQPVEGLLQALRKKRQTA